MLQGLSTEFALLMPVLMGNLLGTELISEILTAFDNSSSLARSTTGFFKTFPRFVCPSGSLSHVIFVISIFNLKTSKPDITGLARTHKA